jgi:plastocyanin
MKISTALTRRLLSVVIMTGAGIFLPAEFAGAASLTITDQNGRPVPNGQPSATTQIVDVAVAPGGALMFSPATVNISVGDTVRWTWGSSGHSVTSGAPCAADSQFCSPDDMNCPAGILSGTGTVYTHTFSQAGTYSYFCSLHCARGMVGTVNVTAPCTAPPANMVGWWPGDGNPRDIQNADNGTLQGGATFAAGKVGQAFSLDVVNSFVLIPNKSSLNPTGPFSVDAWVNANSQQTASQSLIVDKSHGFTDGTGWGMQTNTDGTACFFYGTGGSLSDFHGVCTTTSILDNQWHHLAGVFTGSEFQIYLDGALNNTFTFNVPIVNNTRPVEIGAAWGGGTPVRFFHGLIDEVEYLNRALTQTEIQAIVDAGSGGKCKPPQPMTAVSRKTHGGAGTFDIDLMPNGTPGVECRSTGGVYQMVVQFASPVTASGATVSAGTGAVSGFGVAGAVATIDLMNVTNAQTIVVKITGVSDGTLSGDVPVAMSVLVGDTGGNGSVNAADVGQTKSQSGNAVTGSNFREDVNADGNINASDVGLVKSKSGTALP